MIYKCHNCSTALRFLPQKGLLECDACGTTYQISQYEEPATADNNMDVELYSCTACGATLAVNGTECSSFCSYCGQPTVIYNRVSSVKRPDYIIPFSVSKEEAVELIRNEISTGRFISKKIKHFKAEQVRGIYIPFQLYDIKYTDCQFWSRKTDSVESYHMRKAKVIYHNFTLDASEQLNDDLTQHLEPYFTSSLVPFHSAYLSGFYADCFDYTSEEMEALATSRCRELTNKKLLKTLPDTENQKLRATLPNCDILGSKYALLPAWFMTFRHKNTPYTFLVNGQTSKVVGAVPYAKKKPIFYITMLTALLSLITYLLLSNLFFVLNVQHVAQLLVEKLWIYGILFLVISSVGVWKKGHNKMEKLNAHIKRTKESKLHSFANDREGE